jgi:predicted transcriptional regulator
LCGIECQQGACNEPCDLVLQFGHQVKCVSYCGETCVCPTCKKAGIEEFYREMVVDPTNNDPFIELKDCGHIVEVNYMQDFLLNNLINAQGDRKISHLKCPSDFKIIYQSIRYNRDILEQSNIINKKKAIHLEQELAKSEQLNSLLQKINTYGKELSKEFLESFSLSIKDKKTPCPQLKSVLIVLTWFTNLLVL